MRRASAKVSPDIFSGFGKLLGASAAKVILKFERHVSIHKILSVSDFRGANLKLQNETRAVICFLAVLIYSMGAIYDLLTVDMGNLMSRSRTVFMVFYTIPFELTITALAFWCYRKMIKIDSIWSKNWEIVKNLAENKDDPSRETEQGKN